MGGTTGQQDNPAKWMSLTPSGSGDNVAKDVPSIDLSSQRISVEAEKHKDIPFALPFYSTRIPLQQTSHSCVKFLPTTSSAVMHAGSASDLPKDDLVPTRGIHNPMGVSELERGGKLYNSSGNDLEASESYRHMDALVATQSCQMLNSNNGKAPLSLSRFLQSDEENCSVPVALCLSSHEDREPSNVCEPPPVTVAVPGLRSIPEVPSRANMVNRIRRSRTTEVLKSLQELLPHYEGGCKEDVLDGTIDYVKYLQLQIKTLSQSRLGGEASHDPFVYLEGYGHYLFHDEMLSGEPLEEIIGRLMEVNMPLLNQLLENKGLAVMPMGLAGGLLQLPGRGSSAPTI